MSLLAQLWLPILLSAVFVFFASSLFNMLLKFWHMPDYQGFADEDAVRAAIRSAAGGKTGAFSLPYCTPERMKDPAMHEKFVQGPIAMVMIRRPGPMKMGTPLLQWFVFCLAISFLCALLAVHVLGVGADHRRVFHVLALAAFLGHAAGSIPDAIWWGHPWKMALKYVVDGFVYAVIVGLTFAWLWPAA